MKVICKLDKIFTWILGICFLAFILTGFDIQQRFLSPQISSLIHLKWIVLPALVAFAYHTVYKTYFRICKCERHLRLKKVLLGMYAAFLIWMIIYFIYYQWFA